MAATVEALDLKHESQGIGFQAARSHHALIPLPAACVHIGRRSRLAALGSGGPWCTMCSPRPRLLCHRGHQHLAAEGHGPTRKRGRRCKLRSAPLMVRTHQLPCLLFTCFLFMIIWCCQRVSLQRSDEHCLYAFTSCCLMAASLPTFLLLSRTCCTSMRSVACPCACLTRLTSSAIIDTLAVACPSGCVRLARLCKTQPRTQPANKSMNSAMNDTAPE